MVKEWQKDPSRPNPYVSNERGTFFRRYFSPYLTVHFTSIKTFGGSIAAGQEEVAEAERGQHTPHKVSASVFIRMGLELEDQQ
jgi:hypothetical protein